MSVEDSPFSWGPDGPAPDDEEAAMPKKKKPSERAYARLTRHERQAIEGMPDRGMCFVNLSFHKTASVRFTRQREDSSRTSAALAPILSSPTTPRA